MTDSIDFSKIGLKAGLEIHQQLDTHKLFCSCPSVLRDSDSSFEVKRKLNPVAGESGEIDVAAAYEKSQDKTFVYKVYDTNCLVELDEEPPHSINEEALKIATQIALLLNCKILPVTQVMRKTVVDGSNTSGFQRTVMIAYDGSVESSEGSIGIESVMLEEDSARPDSSKEGDVNEPGYENSKVYKLDRLGIPLVEITTKPQLHSPEQIKEVALKIGEILRACKVRRGIGTIRQDLNVSIKGSERVEIKGFQDPKIMIRTVENEVERQVKCIEEKVCRKEVRKTNLDATTVFLRPMPGSARMYPETDLHLLKISREFVNDAKATLPKLASEHKAYLKACGLNDELVKLVLDYSKVEEFKDLMIILENPNLIAKMIVVFMGEIANKSKKSYDEINDILNMDILEGILDAIKENKIYENDVKMVMQKIADGESLENALKKEKVNLNDEVKKLMKEKPGLSSGAYMGLLMAKLKGKVSGKEIMDELKKVLG